MHIYLDIGPIIFNMTFPQENMDRNAVTGTVANKRILQPYCLIIFIPDFKEVHLAFIIKAISHTQKLC